LVELEFYPARTGNLGEQPVNLKNTAVFMNSDVEKSLSMLNRHPGEDYCLLVVCVVNQVNGG